MSAAPHLETTVASPGAAPSRRGLDVVFVTVADLPEGGGNTSRLRSVVDALVRSGHRVRIWNQHALGVAPPSALRPRGELAGAPYEYVLGTVERSRGFASVAAKGRAVVAIARRIAAAHRAGELDVLWLNNLSFYDGAPLTSLARRLGVAVIHAYEDERHECVSEERRDLATRLFAWNSRLADRRCAPRADALIVISSYLEAKYARLADPRRIHLLPTLLDCDAWDAGEEKDTDEPVILYAGAFGEQDELEGLVDALALLRRGGRRFRAVLLGANEREAQRVAAVRARVRAAGLDRDVELRGFTPIGGVREQLARSNVLVNVRRDGVWSRSGLSTKLSEYLASGRLVVTSDLGDVGRYVRDGESALLVPAGADPGAIAGAIGRALESYALRRRIGAAGREAARRCFDVRAAQARLDAILTAAARGGACAEGAR